jgi:hypothetical protein
MIARTKFEVSPDSRLYAHPPMGRFLERVVVIWLLAPSIVQSGVPAH